MTGGIRPCKDVEKELNSVRKQNEHPESLHVVKNKNRGQKDGAVTKGTTTNPDDRNGFSAQDPYGTN